MAGVMAAALLLAVGCESPSGGTSSRRFGPFGDAGDQRQGDIDPTQIETRDDIVQVIQFWPQWPWLEEANRVVGFRVTVYFVSGQTEKGAFVPGNIFVWLYTLEPTPEGGRERKLAHLWEFDQRESMGFRVAKRAIGGYFYGFPLAWPKELDLEGKQIEIQFGYERLNKKVILGSPKIYRVPVLTGYEPPVERTAP
jgi:hypothetical protein